MILRVCIKDDKKKERKKEKVLLNFQHYKFLARKEQTTKNL